MSFSMFFFFFCLISECPDIRFLTKTLHHQVPRNITRRPVKCTYSLGFLWKVEGGGYGEKCDTDEPEEEETRGRVSLVEELVNL